MGDNYEKENWPEKQNNARFSKHSTPSKSVPPIWLKTDREIMF